MKFAYADPPYPGCGHRYPEKSEVDHVALIRKLVDEYPDGWAMSTHVPGLALILPLCPPRCRIASWCKPFTTWRPGLRIAYAWEPLIWMTLKSKGGKGIPTTRDFYVESQNGGRGSGTRSILGRKPDGFYQWVLDLLGFEQGDEIDDLFPGTGIMSHAAKCRNAGLGERFVEQERRICGKHDVVKFHEPNSKECLEERPSGAKEDR